MDDLPLVSVITPSLNQARFIEQTLASVRDQDYPYVEHIVVDGASSDATVDILKKVADGTRWISEPDQGQADALNKGLSMANGQVVGWLNADDLYEPGAISTAVKFLKANPAIGMVYGDWWKMDQNGKPLELVIAPEFDPQLLLHIDIIGQPAVFLRKSVLDAVGPLDVRFHYSMDYDLFCRIGRRFPVRHIPAVLAKFRLSPETKTSSNPLSFYLDDIIVATKYASRDLQYRRIRQYFMAALLQGLAARAAYARLESHLRHWNDLDSYLDVLTIGRIYLCLEEGRDRLRRQGDILGCSRAVTTAALLNPVDLVHLMTDDVKGLLGVSTLGTPLRHLWRILRPWPRWLPSHWRT